MVDGGWPSFEVIFGSVSDSIVSGWSDVESGAFFFFDAGALVSSILLNVEKPKDVDILIKKRDNILIKFS